MENENKTTYTVLRVLVVGGILAILIFLSIGIVRVIPRAINALASASVSLGSLFDFKSDTATSTPNGFTITSTSTPSDITMSPATTTVATSTPVHTTTPPSTNYTPANSTAVVGTPDIAVTIISRGILDHTTGQYIETNNFTTSDTVVVKFKIENRGNGPTGMWNLRVTMPSTNSVDQSRAVNGNGSMPAGTAIVGQVVFDRPAYGNNSLVTVAVELTQKGEIDTSNNIASTILSVGGTNTGYPGNTGTQADLSGSIIQVGILDNANNFIPTNSFHTYDRVAIKFKVNNTGSNSTGAWNFRADINGNVPQSYTSNEGSIAGNTSLTYIIGFSNLQIGYNTVNIYLDNGNYVYESNEGNNTISTSFNVGY